MTKNEQAQNLKQTVKSLAISILEIEKDVYSRGDKSKETHTTYETLCRKLAKIQIKNPEYKLDLETLAGI